MSDDCSLTYIYACQTTPLTKPPDYPCPEGFYPFKNDCFNPNQLSTDYDSAQVILVIQKDRETERQRDREAERQGDRKTERQREAERQTERQNIDAHRGRGKGLKNCHFRIQINTKMPPPPQIF